jgi:predicted Rossmann fold nucleotide-binding protein DprA/Smf involved in DNA uptake
MRALEYEAALALITLAELPSIGDRRLARIQAWARREGLSLAGLVAGGPGLWSITSLLPRGARARLMHERWRHTAHCRALVARLSAAGVCIASPADATFPRHWLRRADPPPPFVYSYGGAELIELPTVAMLGSRTVTGESVTAAVHVARAAAQTGAALVVGGMKATHRIAAMASRAAGAPRIIVLDRGVFAAFGGRPELDPFGLGPGRSRFDRASTLVLSVFRPDNPANPRTGRRRDELIAALGDAIVALSARPGGEVERICLRALDRGQRVLSWHGNAPGLLAAGAVAVDANDVSAQLRVSCVRRAPLR